MAINSYIKGQCAFTKISRSAHRTYCLYAMNQTCLARSIVYSHIDAIIILEFPNQYDTNFNRISQLIHFEINLCITDFYILFILIYYHGHRSFKNKQLNSKSCEFLVISISFGLPSCFVKEFI